MPGKTVLADAQFGVTKILRPYPNFEDDYQGVSAKTLIMLTEGGVALDAFAGGSGYSPNLAKGLSVPLGATIHLWLPLITANSLVTPVPYQYRLIWRLRNTFDYRQQRIAYHYPKQGAGVPDGASARVVIPAVYQSLIYVETEPGGVLAAGTANARIGEVLPRGDEPEQGVTQNTLLPLKPGAPATPLQIQQGILDPATFGVKAYKPTWLQYTGKCLGDELLIGIYRDVATTANWTFPVAIGAPAVDLELSTLLGKGAIGVGVPFVDVGVYAMFGTPQ